MSFYKNNFFSISSRHQLTALSNSSCTEFEFYSKSLFAFRPLPLFLFPLSLHSFSPIQASFPSLTVCRSLRCSLRRLPSLPPPPFMSLTLKLSFSRRSSSPEESARSRWKWPFCLPPFVWFPPLPWPVDERSDSCRLWQRVWIRVAVAGGGRAVALGEFCSESSEGRLSFTVSGPECVTKKQKMWGAPLRPVISETSNNKVFFPSTPPCVMSERGPVMMTPPHPPPRTLQTSKQTEVAWISRTRRRGFPNLAK